MTVLDLFKLCSYQDVEQELKLHYDDYSNEAEQFRKLYSDLSQMTVKKPINEEMYLCITVRRIQEDRDPAVDVFDENDKDIYFDVSAFKKGNDLLYSICASPYEEFLQYFIDEKTLQRFAPQSILAHALWELTSYGYEDPGSDE